ncbi:MAG TPA: N-acetyl-gamma-glutamyl-phosphate reductase [Candidatus Butyricicoccus avistercoris]|uniref:N-acetyl-gamma-glutamyl-phosphate reductase n=1 Tax=Candidatus Butyricicoccus avistercoris TaxID=2838518 RepID=A0A9D1PL28_9FIRM|nr:N-acetyl-gamma-glutamyl-phosphate reductase [Candidatus Butyricicoccus avistercoris]
MKPVIYIDGKEGTTGLQIYERLGSRDDLTLLLIDEDKRKDPKERAKLMNQADIVFLCLPDAAAREAVTLVTNPNTRIIDASTAHRTNPDWDYGFPELSSEKRQAIANSKRVANPGCHATGFISIVYPLVKLGILPKDYPMSFFSLTGYSGGGKKMIASYESEDKPQEYFAPRIYGLSLNHKHLPEMKAVCEIDNPPVFAPVVDDYYKGMAGTLSLVNSKLNGNQTAEQIHKALCDYYKDQKFVTVEPFGGDTDMLGANTMAGKDSLKIVVCGNENQTMITALFDNLGKGASGAAVQNMNIMLGMDETTGLNI